MSYHPRDPHTPPETSPWPVQALGGQQTDYFGIAATYTSMNEGPSSSAMMMRPTLYNDGVHFYPSTGGTHAPLHAK